MIVALYWTGLEFVNSSRGGAEKLIELHNLIMAKRGLARGTPHSLPYHLFGESEVWLKRYRATLGKVSKSR